MIIKSFLLLSVGAFIIFYMSSCSAIMEGLASFKTPKGFVSFDANIQIESENEEQFAQEIRKIMPVLIDSIEIKLGSRFKYAPAIYVCSSNESFCKYAGAKFPGPRAKVTAKGLFISPRLNGSADWSAIFYHELVHTILFQNIGAYRYYTVPLWFHEGLATCISNGGGSGTVTDSAAIEKILQGNHFYPHPGFIRSYLSTTHLPPWMEYRQYMLYVKFLSVGKEREFNELLQFLLEKKSFSKACKASYGKSLDKFWSAFVEEMKNTRT